MAEFLNLTAMAKVAPTRIYGRLADAVRQFQHVASAIQDVAQAMAALESFKALDQKEPARSTLEAALATQAVILYARAVHSASTGRVKIDIRNQLGDAKLIAMHDSIASLRDDSLAHFGKGKGKHGSGWVNEFVAAKLLAEDQIDVAFPCRRRNHHPDLMNDLGELCPVVYFLLNEAGLRWTDAIKKEWKALPREKNKEIDAYLERYAVDPIAFLGVPAEDAAKFYAGIPVHSGTPGN